MRLYLDACCWNRPFDDQSQKRIRVEAEAVLSILEMAQEGALEIISGDIIDEEIAEIPDIERKEKVQLILALAVIQVSVTPAVEKQAAELNKLGVSPYDALHLASAENGSADCFLTTDDDLLRAAKKLGFKMRIENPATWLIEEATDED